MDNRDFAYADDKSRQIIRTAVTLLAILGLLTAVAVVAVNLYNKLKESVKALNADGVLEPINDGELTGETPEHREQNGGVSVSVED